MKFCGKFELPLRDHDENSDFATPRVFWGLLEFAGKLDENLKVISELLSRSKETSRQSKMSC
jgi:hypothetical protein